MVDDSGYLKRMRHWLADIWWILRIIKLTEAWWLLLTIVNVAAWRYIRSQWAHPYEKIDGRSTWGRA